MHHSKSTLIRTQADYLELQLYGGQYSGMISSVPGSLYQFLIALTVIHLHFYTIIHNSLLQPFPVTQTPDLSKHDIY